MTPNLLPDHPPAATAASPLLGEAAQAMLLDRVAELLWLQDVGTKTKARLLADELYRVIVEPLVDALVAERERTVRERIAIRIGRWEPDAGGLSLGQSNALRAAAQIARGTS